MGDDFVPIENDLFDSFKNEEEFSSFFGGDLKEIESINLFEEVLGDRGQTDLVKVFDPLDYLVNIEEYLKHNPINKIECDISEFTKETLAMLPGMEWLNFVNCHLVVPVSNDVEEQKKQVDKFVEKLKSEGICLEQGFCPGAFPKDFKEPVLALDTETTSLDTRCMYDYDGKLIKKVNLVGCSVAVSDNEGYYLPVLHTGDDCVLNWDLNVILYFFERLHKEFFLIYHHAKYDREVMAINGLNYFRKWPYFCDTMLLDFIYNVNNKSHGLKVLSERLLSRKMIEIEQLFNLAKKKKGMNVNFNRIPAKAAYVYACSDAMNTYGLFKHYASKEESDNLFFNSSIPLTIDHKSVDVLRNLSRAGVPVDLDYYLYAAKDVEYRIMLLEEEIYNYVGRKFDINSPDQVSDLLFNEYSIPVLSGEEKNKKGRYSTKEDVLKKLFDKYPDYPILKYVVTYRKLTDIMSKTYLKVVLNFYIDALLPWTRVHAQYSQTVIPTGRFSSSSNSGRTRVQVKTTKTGNLTYNYFVGSGDAGFNMQGIPNPHFKLKKAKRIKKISPDAGMDIEKVYPDEVIQNLIKRTTAI